MSKEKKISDNNEIKLKARDQCIEVVIISHNENTHLFNSCVTYESFQTNGNNWICIFVEKNNTFEYKL